MHVCNHEWHLESMLYLDDKVDRTETRRFPRVPEMKDIYSRAWETRPSVARHKQLQDIDEIDMQRRVCQNNELRLE